LPHAELEGAALEPQTVGGVALAGDLPAALAQDGLDVRPLHVVQARERRDHSVRDLGEGRVDLEVGPGADDERALDQIFELADVPGPGVRLEGTTRRPR